MPLPGKYVVLTLAMGVVYFILAETGHFLSVQPSDFATFWPASGFFLAMVVRFPRRAWPAIFMGSFAGNLASDVLLQAKPLWMGLAFGLGNGLEAALGAWLLFRLGGQQPFLGNFSKVLGFLAVALCAPVCSATLGAWALTGGSGDFFYIWIPWYGANALGILLVGAPILCWGARERTCLLKEKARLLELLVLTSCLGLACFWVFSNEGGLPRMPLRFPYVAFPFLVWASLRFDPRIASTLVLFAGFIMIFGTSRNQGPFTAALTVEGQAVVLQCFLTMASGITLFMAATVEERKFVQEDRDRVIAELRVALGEIRTLKGLIPICCGCKKIRGDEGYWHNLETYLSAQTGADFSHGICPDCGVELYGELWREAMKATG